MSTLKIELTLDGTNEELTLLTVSLMAALAGQSIPVKASAESTSKIEEPKEEAIPEKPKRTRKSSKKEKEEEIDAEDENETGAEVKDETTPSADLDSIRELMAKKIGEHRVEIKKKMTSMDAGNLSSIPEDKFEEFFSFLQKLS